MTIAARRRRPRARNYTTATWRGQAGDASLQAAIRHEGGIRLVPGSATRTEWIELQRKRPALFRRRAGLVPDELAETLGFESDSELYEALAKEIRSGGRKGAHRLGPGQTVSTAMEDDELARLERAHHEETSRARRRAPALEARAAGWKPHTVTAWEKPGRPGVWSRSSRSASKRAGVRINSELDQAVDDFLARRIREERGREASASSPQVAAHARARGRELVAELHARRAARAGSASPASGARASARPRRNPAEERAGERLALLNARGRRPPGGKNHSGGVRGGLARLGSGDRAGLRRLVSSLPADATPARVRAAVRAHVRADAAAARRAAEAFALALQRRRRPNPVAMSEADALYQRFHGYAPREHVEIPLPKELELTLPPLTYLGKAEQLVYSTRKKFDRGRLIDYDHTFEGNTHVFAHPRQVPGGPNVLVLVGDHEVRPEGITN